MNKVYKVIWNKVKECYVVVSELAKGASKASGGRHSIVTALTLSLLLSIGGKQV